MNRDCRPTLGSLRAGPRGLVGWPAHGLGHVRESCTFYGEPCGVCDLEPFSVALSPMSLTTAVLSGLAEALGGTEHRGLWGAAPVPLEPVPGGSSPVPVPVWLPPTSSTCRTLGEVGSRCPAGAVWAGSRVGLPRACAFLRVGLFSLRPLAQLPRGRKTQALHGPLRSQDGWTALPAS